MNFAFILSRNKEKVRKSLWKPKNEEKNLKKSEKHEKKQKKHEKKEKTEKKNEKNLAQSKMFFPCPMLIQAHINRYVLICSRKKMVIS